MQKAYVCRYSRQRYIIGTGAFNECENLNNAKIGNGVTYIAYGAFMGCGKLSALTIGNSVSEICEAAFYSCNALQSVTIPASAIFIGKDAFSYTGLTSAAFESKSGWVANKNDVLTSEQLSDTANAAKLLTTSVLDKGYAEAEWEKPTLTYTLSSDGTYYIVNNSGSVSRSVIEIPEKYNGKPVRALAQNAFKDCKSLTGISLPGCMLSIPTNAFSGCTALEDITVRGYLVSDYEEVYASSDGVLYNADFTKILVIPAAKSEITISGSSIASEQFKNNTSLKKIIIDATSIDYAAFRGCTNLTSVVMTDKVTSIGENAFFGCSNLTDVKIGKGVTTIYDSTFENCDKLVYTEFANSLYLGNDENPYVVLIKAKNTDITSCKVNANTKSINRSAFYGCNKLTKVTMQNGITTIGDSAFRKCSALTSVAIPDSVTSIGKYVFGDCDKLQYNEYKNWLYLGNATNPYTVLMTVKDYKTTTCEINEKTTLIAGGAFSACSNLISITVPAGITSARLVSELTGCYNLESITVDENDKDYASADGILCNKEMTEILFIPNAIKGEIIIPDGITTFGTLFQGRSNITAITIPDSVNSIDESAFRDCTGLENVFIPESVTSIGEYAFYSCTSLTGVTIPDYVTSIGSNTFSGCTSLENVTFSDGIESIGNSAFYNCTSLTGVKLPNHVKSIGSSAFSNCTSLENVAFSDGIESIGNSAFNNCSSLTSINLPDSLKKIDSDAFAGCTALQDVRINDLGKWCAISFGYGAFDKTYNLYVNNKPVNHLTLPEGIDTVKAYSFAYCGSITGVTIPNSVTVIGNGAFYGCSGLTSIVIPNSVTSIGSNAFYGCNSLESMSLSAVNSFGWIFGASSYENNSNYIPESLKTVTITGGTKIAEDAFRNCGHLTSISIPDSVTSIGRSAFKGCVSLENLSLPFVGASLNGTSNTHFGYIFGADTYRYQASSVPQSLNVTIRGGTTIAEDAFYECKLVGITLGNGVKSLERNAFISCKPTNLTISDSVTTADSFALSNCSFENLTLPANVLTVSYGHSLYLSQLKTLTITSGKLMSYKATDGTPVTGLDGCRSLTSVIIKSGVTSIGDRVFDGVTAITNLVIENGLTSIGEYAFRGCTSLKEVVIPNSVTSIGHCAFWDCSGIESVTIGTGVNFLDYGAFLDCTVLTNITYNGTKTQWNAIKKDRWWDNNTGKYTIHCTDGNILKK